ncbi:molybdenum cofactor biosynthesis protein MoaE, partial [Chloroflexota bacterium]
MITDKPISPETVVNGVKNTGSGCVLAYIGLIREHSHNKQVSSVEYRDSKGTAETGLQKIISEVKQQWPVEDISICHRTGKLNVGDINLVIAVASAHRQEAFTACQYAIDQFKQRIPTDKIETYQDG